MNFRDPIAAYNAKSNMEAHMVCSFLLDHGIEALVVEDLSQWSFGYTGPLAELHKPQVWIEKADVEKARGILTEFEKLNAGSKLGSARVGANAGPIDATCEECGKTTKFPGKMEDTVQNCPHCRAFMDVGEPPDWGDSETTDSSE